MKLLNDLIASFKQNILAMVDPSEDDIRCKNICIKLINHPDAKLAYSSKSSERFSKFSLTKEPVESETVWFTYTQQVLGHLLQISH
jgi:hypothetical protein